MATRAATLQAISPATRRAPPPAPAPPLSRDMGSACVLCGTREPGAAKAVCEVGGKLMCGSLTIPEGLGTPSMKQGAEEAQAADCTLDFVCGSCYGLVRWPW